MPLNPLDLGLGFSRQLPDLGNLSKLTALTLAENMLQQVPSSISKLKSLKLLDLSCNDDLKARFPHNPSCHPSRKDMLRRACRMTSKLESG